MEQKTLKRSKQNDIHWWKNIVPLYIYDKEFVACEVGEENVAFLEKRFVSNLE